MMRLALQRVLEEVMAEPSLTQGRESARTQPSPVTCDLVKSVVISSCKRLSRCIANALELPVATHAQHLGREVRYTKQRRVGLRRQQWKKALHRIRRAVQLRKKGAKIAALLRANPVATGTWGIASDGVTGVQLNSFRCKVVRAARRLPVRAAPLLHMQSDASLAKVDPAIAVHAT
eukprot:1999724-Amphidinium_carterae.2